MKTNGYYGNLKEFIKKPSCLFPLGFEVEFNFILVLSETVV